jgi:beta,beta-carotene 9',10'-dioxygenase
VAKFFDKYVALTEIPLPVEFEKNTLETLGVFSYQDRLPKTNCWESAHPHINERKDEVINLLLKFGSQSEYVIHQLEKETHARKIISQILVDEPAYMHSFSITENFVILTEYPFVVNPVKLLLKNKPFIQNFTWKPTLGTRFRIVEKKTGNVFGPFTAESCFSFHHVNAYEKDDEIILDLISYPDASIVYALADYGKSSNPLPQSQLMRYLLNIKRGIVDEQVLFSHALEMPRINPKNDGYPYQYLYAVDLNLVLGQNELRNIYKIDLHTLEFKSWAEAGCYPGEPVFILKPDATKEDDGVILSVVLDGKRGTSFLLILDASSFQEIGRATVPHHIPAGLHGQFFY